MFLNDYLHNKLFCKKRGEILVDKPLVKDKSDILSNFGNLSKDEKIDLLYSMVLSLKEKTPGDFVPIGVFDNDKLSIFEALVKYLRENLEFRFVKIASLLNRSDKTIWATYNKAKKKFPSRFPSIVSDINIPIMKFSDRDFTIFESLVLYLKNYGLRNHEIAVRLHRDDRTIWSVYSRVKKKVSRNG